MQELFKPTAKYIGSKGNSGASDTTILDGSPGLSILSATYSFYRIKGLLADNANAWSLVTDTPDTQIAVIQ